MATIRLRKEIIARACDFKADGLSVGRSGNISVRCDEGLLITPTGFAYEKLGPLDLSHCSFDGEVLEGKWAPSSEWPFHAAIYQARADVEAIVHCHSPYATAIACARKSIPAFHYMVAVAGGHSIECADYATFGSVELSKNALAALGERKACLLANHGQIAVGASVAEAYELAQEVEALARQYILSLQLGKPVLLDAAEMDVNLEKFSRYGTEQETE